MADALVGDYVLVSHDKEPAPAGSEYRLSLALPEDPTRYNNDTLRLHAHIANAINGVITFIPRGRTPTPGDGAHGLPAQHPGDAAAAAAGEDTPTAFIDTDGKRVRHFVRHAPGVWRGQLDSTKVLGSPFESAVEFALTSSLGGGARLIKRPPPASTRGSNDAADAADAAERLVIATKKGKLVFRRA